jgi:hypothetical protein
VLSQSDCRTDQNQGRLHGVVESKTANEVPELARNRPGRSPSNRICRADRDVAVLTEMGTMVRGTVADTSDLAVVRWINRATDQL